MWHLRWLKVFFFLVAGFNLIPLGAAEEIRYIPVGDSYTIGTGAETEEAWPNLLVEDLKAQGFSIELIANPAVSGYTTQNTIDAQLAVVESKRPNFVTLLIGANDVNQRVSAEDFRSNLQTLIRRLLFVVQEKSRLVLITIPDFSSTPTGGLFFQIRFLSKKIEVFNKIIKEEAKRQGLKVIDLYPVSKKMAQDPDSISSDGLHPSAKGYRLWEELILKEVSGVLLKRR